MTEPKDIKAFAFDIDGVFTNGGVLCDINGELLRTYDAKDCFAVRMATMMGFPIAIITGGSSTSINVRFSTLGLNKEDVYMKSRIKTEDLQDFCTRHGLSAADANLEVQRIERCLEYLRSNVSARHIFGVLSLTKPNR